MITRRCSQRCFLLRPDPETNNAFIYCLAYAAARTGVDVFFFLAMSNHYHAGIVDNDGRLPEFLESFHKLFAKHQNALRGRWENFWAPEQTSAVELVERDDVLAKMVYGLSNPVKDNLTHRAKDWPGATSLIANLSGGTVRASRPRRFFREDGEMPATVELRIAVPPGFGEMDPAAFVAILKEHLQRAERSAAEQRKSTGGTVLGRQAVLKQDWRSQPETFDPHRQLNPRVACRNVWRRIEALVRNRAWLIAYRAARDVWLSGERPSFPIGTYWLRRFAGVPCAAAPTPS
jgi:putative transposase